MMAGSPKRLILGAILIVGIGFAVWLGLFPRKSPLGENQCQSSQTISKRLSALAIGGMTSLTVKPHSKPLPSLTFNDSKGTPTTLEAFRGKALFVNLWATWCAPCREEMPTLNALERDFGGNTFAVLAINVDTRATDRPRQWLKENAIDTLPYYSDSTGTVLKTLQWSGHAPGLPATILIDSNGCEVATLLGGADWASPEARKIVEVLAASSPKNE